MKTTLKNEDDLKNEYDLKNEDDHKNVDVNNRFYKIRSTQQNVRHPVNQFSENRFSYIP